LSNQHILSDQHSEITLIAKGAGIVFSGTILGTGLRYLFEIIAARNLGTELFGLFFLGLAVLKISEVLSTLGLHRGVLRFIAIYQGIKDDRRTKGTIIFSLKASLFIGLVLSAAIIFLSKFLALNIFHKTDLASVLRFFAFAVPFTAVTTIFVFSTQGFKIMKYRVYVREIFEPLSRLAILFIVLTLGWKLFGAIFAFVVSISGGTFLAFHFLRNLFPELANRSIKPIFESRKIMEFSWPLLLAEFFGLIIIWLNILMIGFFRTAHEVGIYSASHRTAILGQIVLISFNAIFSPIIADLYNKNETRKLDSLFKIVTKWIFSLSIPICLLMVLCASKIMNLFGKNFTEAAFCLIVLSLAQLINSLFGSSGFLIMMSGRSKLNLINNIAVVTLNIGLNCILIPQHGIVGAAFSLFISVLFINLIMLLEVYLIFRLHPFRRDLLKPLFAGGISFLALTFIRRYLTVISNNLLSIIIVSSIFIIIYFVILYVLKIEEEDKVILKRIKFKLPF
jgi:O-antigen/teichoic acid export membrane protein